VRSDKLQITVSQITTNIALKMAKYTDFVSNVCVRIQGETQHTLPAAIKGPKSVWTEPIEFTSVR
jgi:hypothetical protein